MSFFKNENNKKITNIIQDLDKRLPQIHCCWEGKLVQTLWKSVWAFIKNYIDIYFKIIYTYIIFIYIALPCTTIWFWLSILYFWRILTQCTAESCNPYLIFTIDNLWNQLISLSPGEEIMENTAHIYNGISFSCKEKLNGFIFWKYKQLQKVILSKSDSES